MRKVFLVAVLLALPAIAFSAHRPASRSHHSAPVTHSAKPAAAPVAPPVAAATGDPLSTIETNAQFAVVMDYETGALLFSKRGDELMKPASMAKLMTVSILFEKLKHGELHLDDTFIVSEKAWRPARSLDRLVEIVEGHLRRRVGPPLDVAPR